MPLKLLELEASSLQDRVHERFHFCLIKDFRLKGATLQYDLPQQNQFRLKVNAYDTRNT